MTERQVLHGGTVLTGPQWRPRPADLLIAGGRIEAVAAPGGLAGVDAATHDVTGRLVIPGLINAHTHSHTAPARGAARAWTLEDSLLNGGWMAAPRSEELTELAALLTATELIASGCTGAFDLIAQAGGPDPAGCHAAARGYARAGLRTVLAPMVADRTLHEAVPAIGACCGAPATGKPGPSTADVLAACTAYVRNFPALQGVMPALAPTIPGHCTPELTVGLGRLAAEHGLRVHTHLAESKPQALAGASRFGHSITRELARLGVLGDRLTVAHAIWVDDEDIRMLAASGAVAVTVPGSNLRLGSGIADTRAMLAAGLRLAVGTDGANSADAFDALDAVRLTALLSRVSERPARQWLTVEETLDAATAGGAAACGWTDTGRLAPGQRADFALLDLGARAFRPPTDLANQLLTAARAADVTDVVVGGRFVYRDRAFPHLDVAAALNRFDTLVEEFCARVAPARADADRQAALAATALAGLRRAPSPVRRLIGWR
ncbi:amidohydrolase family protein [Mycolicibacterium austroafricanum]|uniref:amidohydrolase family protein n=1 Tax=Mycolicibacterium austroafricanum TaxID=39687 RepID=UPI001CA34ECE|nr:amidohydrolase family protein [Mycolicibacterium austroafricanum]QZT54497.1 amidohydrolase family protein [Mycolicibacterium austroafricanum]